MKTNDAGSRTHPIADYVKASRTLQIYLQQGHPLDKSQHTSVVTALMGLQHVLAVWHNEQTHQRAKRASELENGHHTME